MELYWYLVVMIFIIVKIFFYVCWYRSRQRQLATCQSNPRNAQIVIVGGRAYLHQMYERQSQTAVWPSRYGLQDDQSIGEPSSAPPPAASFSQLDMPPPYEAVSREDDLKPPPYSECAHAAPSPSHQTPLISEGGHSNSVNGNPPPYMPLPPAQLSHQHGPISPNESHPESRST